MVDGQSYKHGICPTCYTNLPDLIHEHGWPTVDCPNPKCEEWFDTNRYEGKANGKFYNNGACHCHRCMNS